MRHGRAEWVGTDKFRFHELYWHSLGMKREILETFQKLHICTLFLPWGRHWDYLRSTGISFRDIDRSSKLPYLGMKPEIRKKFQRLHMYSLSTLGRKWAYFRSSGSCFRDRGLFCLNCDILTWNLEFEKSFRRVPSFYPRDSKLSLFSLYGHRFQRYRPKIFQISIFGPEASSRSCICTPVLPMGFVIKRTFALRAAVSPHMAILT